MSQLTPTELLSQLKSSTSNPLHSLSENSDLRKSSIMRLKRGP